MLPGNLSEEPISAAGRIADKRRGRSTYEAEDIIYSNDDFKRIKVLQAKEEEQHGLLKGTSIKIPTPSQLSLKPLDPTKFQSKRKLTKEQRVAMAKAGREGREPYKAKAAHKKKNAAGSSNRKKERDKLMPRLANSIKISKKKEMRKKKQKLAKNQFRGKKAWKK